MKVTCLEPNAEILENILFDAHSSESDEFISGSVFHETLPFAYMNICHFNVGYYSQNYYKSLGVDFPEEIRRAVPKRQAEYLAGRYCAKNALLKSELIPVDSDSNIAIGKQRNPIWPKDILGSITHTNEIAISIVSSQKAYQYVGIDFEVIMSPQTATEVQTQIVSKNELALLNKIDLPLSVLITLSFSAKESLYKGLYQSTLEFFGFEVASIKEVDLKNNVINLSIDKVFANKHRIPINYSLGFRISNSSIFTFLIA